MRLLRNGTRVENGVEAQAARSAMEAEQISHTHSRFTAAILRCEQVTINDGTVVTLYQRVGNAFSPCADCCHIRRKNPQGRQWLGKDLWPGQCELHPTREV
jgi:hypothetical protein